MQEGSKKQEETDKNENFQSGPTYFTFKRITSNIKQILTRQAKQLLSRWGKS